MAKKRNKFPFVEVEWLDAISVSAWQSLEEATSHRAVIHTRGWMIHENDEYYTLAGTMGDPAGNGKDDNPFGEVSRIPTGMVRRIRKMKQ